MALFDGMAGGGGLGGSPSAFTSPGIDPTVLALLMRMQGMGGAGMGAAAGGGPAGGVAPQLPALPQGLGAGGAMPQIPGAGAGGPAGAAGSPQMMSILQQIGGIDGLKKLLGDGGLAGLFGGGAGGGPATGTGGLY